MGVEGVPTVDGVLALAWFLLSHILAGHSSVLPRSRLSSLCGNTAPQIPPARALAGGAESQEKRKKTGTASIHRQQAAPRNGTHVKEGCEPVSVSAPLPSFSAAPVYNTASFADSSATLSSKTRPEAVHSSAWVEAGPSSQTDPTAEPVSFVEGMRRVLGSLHIKGISADKLHRGKTQKQDAPFANCTTVLEPPLNVIIIGSGFAGFSAAIACARQGFTVVMLEKGSGLSPHGDLISFCPNANRILRRWGLDGLMWERSAQGGSMIIHDSDGFPINRIHMDDIAQQYGSPMFQGHRAQFLGVFGVEARMLGVEVIPYAEVVDILDNLDRPACITSDGRVFHGDVVLVADGCNSALRRIVFGTESKESSGGYGIHRSIMKVPKAFREDPKCAHLLDGNVRAWLGDDCHAFFAPLDHGNQMSISITHVDINKTASFNWKDIKSMEEIKSFVTGWDDSFLAALKYFKTGLHWRLFHHEPIPSWTSANGRVAFFGDAIHTYLPTSLQGATASVEDGAVIALSLALSGGKASNVPLALRVFQKLRQETVRKRAESGALQREIWHKYHTTRNEKDSRLLALDFFKEDAELFTLRNFEILAVEEDKYFRIDDRKFKKAMKLAGF